MLILGKCVLCGKEVSLVADSEVGNGSDRPVIQLSSSQVSLLVSPTTFLLSLGWLTRGRKEEDWQDLLKRYAGENFREFIGSRVCPECFPSDPDDDQENTRDEGADDEGADDEGADDEGADDEGADDEGADDEGADDEGADDEFAQVLGLLIRTDGRCEKISVTSVQDVCEILGCDSADHYYDREFAIWIYRSDSQTSRSKVNVYASSIANSFISGDCVLLYDLNKAGSRVDHWTDMGNHWFDDPLFQMIQRCNKDADAISFLERHQM